MKALDAATPPQWLRLTQADNITVQVRALSAVERRAMLAALPKPAPLGYALQAQRAKIGEGLGERERLAEQMEWVKALPDAKRAALMDAQTYQAKRLRAWAEAAALAVTIDGEMLDGLTPLEFLDCIGELDTAIELLVEVGSVCEDYSTLGKAGPLCSERLCGPPTGSPGAGTASDAPPPSESSAATVVGCSVTTLAAQFEAQAASRDETTQAG